MKWFCEDCESYFNEDEIETEYESHSELRGSGGEMYEKYCVCPVCRSYAITECDEECEICHEMVPHTTYFAGRSVCKGCKQALMSIISDTKQRITDELGVDTYEAQYILEDYFQD